MNKACKTLALVVPIAVASVAVRPVAAQMQTGGYIKLVGGRTDITGEETDPAHAGWISIASVKVDSIPEDMEAKQLKKKIGTLTMTRQSDRSSQELMAAAFTGQKFKEVLIDFYESPAGQAIRHLLT
jgi:type VI protein secretion system component Hcp